MFGLWDMIIVAIIGGVGLECYRTYAKKNRRTRSDDELFQRMDDLEQNSNFADLEERVRNLEAIITDKKTRLNDEINSL